MLPKGTATLVLVSSFVWAGSRSGICCQRALRHLVYEECLSFAVGVVYAAKGHCDQRECEIEKFLKVGVVYAAKGHCDFRVFDCDGLNFL